jgi:pimeloyl-ACP methyl ester carboxylesterase
MMRALKFAALWSVLVLSSAAAEPFSRPTADKLTVINGQIDFPAGAAPDAKVPAVVLIAGSGLFDRHMLIGVSGQPGDFVFDDLSVALTAKGLAVVRFDYRGVTCNTRDPRIAGEKDISRQQALIGELCVDQALRSTVTPETNLEDFAAVVAHARAHPRIDAARIGLMGVSEGALYIGRLLSRDPTLARAAILIGAPLESPMAIMQWQSTERIDTSLRAMMSNAAQLTADEIRAKHASSRLQPFPLTALLPKSGDVWTAAQLDQLKEVREKAFAAARAASLLNADTDPYPGSGVTRASYRWWNMFHRDDTPIINHFATFKGSLTIAVGEKDSQVDVVRQKAALAKSAVAGASNLTWMTYPGRGHTLGEHALLAPMDPAIRDELAARAAADLAAK